MNELLTAGLTVFGGAVVLVVGQVVQRFYIEPIQEQRKIIGEIAFALIYDANVVRELVAEERAQETATRLRMLASRLRATVRTIPNYAFFAPRLGAAGGQRYEGIDGADRLVQRHVRKGRSRGTPASHPHCQGVGHQDGALGAFEHVSRTVSDVTISRCSMGLF